MIPGLDELKTFLQEGEVNLTFKKKNGELRDMVGTTNPNMICEEDLPAGNNSKTKPDDLVVLYDVDKQAWRSFRFDRLTYVRSRSKVTVTGGKLARPTKTNVNC